MAISVDQTVQLDSGSSSSYNITTSSTGTGKRLIVAYASSNAFVTQCNITSITDNQSNTWSSVITKNVTSCTAEIWSTGLNATSGVTTITVNQVNWQLGVGTFSQFYEVSNTDILDKTSSNNGTGTTLSSGATATPAGAADLAIGVGVSADATTSNPTSIAFTSSGITSVGRNFGASFITCLGATGSLILPSATAQTFTYTGPSSAPWAAAIALWKPVVTQKGGTLGMMGVG